MPLFSAGYIIEEVADFLKSEGYDQLEEQLIKHAHFELTSTLNFSLSQNLISSQSIKEDFQVDPIWSVAYNLVSRGILTQCPFSSSVQILQNTLDSRFTTHKTEGVHRIGVQPAQLRAIGDPTQVFYGEARSQESIFAWRTLLLSPVLIAQIQKSILYLVSMGLLDVQASHWRILIIERDIHGAYFALRELEATLNALFILYGRESEFPTIQLDVLALEEETAVKFCPMENLINLDACKPSEYDLILDIETFAFYAPPIFQSHRNLPYFRLRPAGESFLESPEAKFSFKDSISYPDWEKRNADEVSLINTSVEDALSFLLRDLFRSVIPTSEIASLLSPILSSKNRLLWSNSPDKRTIVQILGALLQPGISVWICPSKLDQTRLVRWFRQGRLAEYSSLRENPEWGGEQYRADFPWGDEKLVILSPDFFTRDFLAEDLTNFSFAYAFIEEAHQVSLWSPVFHILYPSIASKIRDCFPYILICPSTGLVNHNFLYDIFRHFQATGPANLQELWEGSERPHIQYKVVPVAFQGTKASSNGHIKGISLVRFPMIKRILKNISFELPGRPSSLLRRKPVSNAHISKIPLGLIYLEESVAKPLGEELKKYLESEKLRISLLPNGAPRQYKNDEPWTYLSPSSVNKEIDVLISRNGHGFPLKLLPARYTLHLHSPTSLEKFYLETDFPLPYDYIVNSYIIYNPSDESNPPVQKMQEVPLTFENDPRAIREFNALEELLNEITFPDGFFAQYLEAKIQKLAGEDIQIQFLVEGNNQGRLDLFAYNQAPEGQRIQFEKIGSIRFPELVGSVEVIKGINVEMVSTLLNAIIATLNRFRPVNGYLNSFPQLKGIGIKSLLNEFHGASIDSIPLTISYENEAMGQLVDLVNSEGYYHLREVEVETIYEQVDSFSDFIRGLRGLAPDLEFSDACLKMAKEYFFKIRRKEDTLQVLYKLETLGLVDLIELENDLGVCHIYLSKKEESFIRSKFEQFVKSYLISEEEKKWLKVKEKNHEGVGWDKWAHELTAFFHGYILPKNQNSLAHGPKAVKYGAEIESGVIEEYIKYYFYALYALPDFLPATLQEEPNPIAIMKKYLGYLINPPKTLDLGSSWANLGHFSSSCQLVKQGFPDFQILLEILQNFADLGLFFFPNNSAVDKAKLEEKMDQLVSGVLQLQKVVQLEDSIAVFEKMHEVAEKIHPEFGRLMGEAQDIFMASCYSNWLSNFNHKFIDTRVSN